MALRALSRLRSGNLLAYTAVFIVVITLLTATAIWQIEGAAGNPEVTSFADALWWALATITTVGYGDVAIQEPLSRLIGSILMIIGISLFGTFTALVSSRFMTMQGEHNRQEHELTEIRKQLTDIQEKLNN